MKASKLSVTALLIFSLSSHLLAEDTPPTPQPEEPETQQETSTTTAAGHEADQTAKQAEDKHVISQSRVFSVSGGDAMRMGAIASRADDVRHQLSLLLKLPESRSINISIRLHGKNSDPRVYPSIERRLDIIGEEPSLSLIVAAGGGLDVQELSKNIVAMCLYEYAFRGIDADAFDGDIALPEWLIIGIQQAVLWRNGKIDRQIYQQLFERAEMLSPEQILECEDPAALDAASKQIYEASCAVIILGLLNQENGDESVREMLRDSLLAEGSARELIGRYFHQLGVSSNSLVKWWALELANLAVPKTTEALTPMETERALSEALCITYYDPITRLPERVSFDDAYRIVQLQDWENQLRPIPAALTHMSVRCFPSYRPFILEYVRAMEVLLKTKDPDSIQGIIGPLRELREAYIITSRRVRDYLDWYEITHTGQERSSSFKAYLDAMSMLRNEQSSKDTPISLYLRDIETLYKLPSGENIPQQILQENEPKEANN